MDFDFSSEQEQLRDAVRSWVRKSYSFDRRQRIANSGGFSRDVHSELSELGLTALCIPEEDGGLGLGSIEAMVIMEELGRGIVLEPLAQAFIAGRVLAQSANELVKKWLPEIASGDKIVVMAHQERDARYDLSVCSTTASAVGSGWSIDGHKSLVPIGDQADAFIVPAKVNGQMALFVVERASAGVALNSYQTQDEGRAAELNLSGAPAELVTREGYVALLAAADFGIACACAEATGVMEAMLAEVIEYLKIRKQFGVPLASFQALRHRVADMKMQLELARSMTYHTVLMLDEPAEKRQLAASRAKYQVGCSMRFIGQQGVQLHGGIGMTDEYVVSHYFKRLTQLEMTLGDTLHHLSEMSNACGIV